MPRSPSISESPHTPPASAHPEPSASLQSPSPEARQWSSAVYVGWVRHRRFAPIVRSFAFPLYMLYVDLDEIDQVLATGRLWASDHRRRALALGRFSRRDYLGDPSRDLRSEVLDRVQRELAFRPSGPVRLLTHARQYGCVFNPVSFYYCFDREPATGSESLSAIVAEITNTPWKERHAYVLDCRASPDPVPDRSRSCDTSSPRRFIFEKTFHVSPFLPMGLAYDWALSVPCPKAGSRLAVHMTLRETDHSQSVCGVGTRPTPRRRVFDATLRLDRRAIGPRTLDAMLLRFPFMTARVVLSIHFHALRLWLRRVPTFPHPNRRPGSSRSAEATRDGVESESVHHARVEPNRQSHSTASGARSNDHDADRR